MLDAALAFVEEKCPASLVHGDARLGNALFRNGECTIVDWECAQNGTPLFDMLYCVWLCLDQSTDDEREFIDRHLHAPSRTMSQRNLDETRAIMRDTKSVARMYVREVQAGKVFKKRVIVSRGGRPAE